MSNHIAKCLICVALVLLFLLGYRAGRQRVSPAPIASPDTIYRTDTLWREAPPVIKEVPVPVPQDVDTAAILEAYFTKRIYNDTLVNDNLLSIAVEDTVFQNTLLNRRAVYTLKVPAYQRAISFGVAVAHRSFALMAGYRHNRTEYQLGYDMYNRSLMVGAKFDIARW